MIEKKASSIWIILAIAFFLIALVEGVFIYSAWNLGNEMFNNENRCMTEICGDMQYDSYSYDEIDKVCDCYSGNNLTKTIYM